MRTQIYISLLKGINVGGHKKIKMADLKAMYVRLGAKDVVTYIQSGNVLFREEETDITTLTLRLESAIQETFGFHVSIICITAAYLQELAHDNPFITDRKENTDLLHLTFLADVPKQENLNLFHSQTFPPDEIALQGKALYLFCPLGYGKTKYAPDYIERKLKVITTTRNWKTVMKLIELSKDLERLVD